ncbi:MAG TPA: ASCH domain-containing protein [Puia sp.]|uniref:ASCH domain-containing protein n=1 Tax=Puia sp. TaxID=2045100 RepID=UPI002CF7CA1B|nr:ASCH domain-containing protein [Puia sp.]HVU96882.1 ASCH domain-containing protein [Puia sp.]
MTYTSKIKGISIRQPWADLILRGLKTIELREYRPPDGWPDYLVIHAPRMIEYAPAAFFGYREPWKLPVSKLLALARIEKIISINEQNWLDYVDAHKQFFPADGEFYGLQLADIKIFDRPIEYPGQVILFDIRQDICDLIVSTYL